MPRSAYTKTYERFRERLVEERERAGLTQVALAGKLGRPQSFVSKYERGERRLDVVELIEIARALRFDAGELVRELSTRQRH